MILGYDEIQCYMSERKHVMWNTSNMTFLDLACFSHFHVLKPVSSLWIFYLLYDTDQVYNQLEHGHCIYLFNLMINHHTYLFSDRITDVFSVHEYVFLKFKCEIYQSLKQNCQ